MSPSIYRCKRLAKDIIAGIRLYNEQDKHKRPGNIDHGYTDDFNEFIHTCEALLYSAEDEGADVEFFISLLEEVGKNWVKKAAALKLFSEEDIVNGCLKGKTPPSFQKI